MRVTAKDLIFDSLLKRGYTFYKGSKVYDLLDSKLLYLSSKQSKAYVTFCKKVSPNKYFSNTEDLLLEEK